MCVGIGLVVHAHPNTHMTQRPTYWQKAPSVVGPFATMLEKEMKTTTKSGQCDETRVFTRDAQISL